MTAKQIKPGVAIHHKPGVQIVNGKISNTRTFRSVRVMTHPIEGYVMVRRKGCMPYVAPVKEIEQ